VSDDVVLKVATRCLRGAYKRHGTYVLSREEVEVLPVDEIDL